MINLNKLEELNNTILNDAEDKEVLLNYYSTALNGLNKIEEQFNKCLDLVVNIDGAIELLSKIGKKTNKEFFPKTLLTSTGNLIKFIQVRKELITKAYNLVEKNNSLKYFVENYPEILMFNHNESNVSILESDISITKAATLERDYNLESAQNKEDLTGLGYLFFGNVHFKFNLSVVEGKADPAENDLLDEIYDTYPTFLTDFRETLETLKRELKESGKLLKDYVETSNNIYNIYDKYKD